MKRQPPAGLGLACIGGLVENLGDLVTTDSGIKALEFHTYVRCNAPTIANDAERHRYAERVLDDTLRAKFRSGYPGLFNVHNPDHAEQELAA